jgi:hypothetical protein
MVGPNSKATIRARAHRKKRHVNALRASNKSHVKRSRPRTEVKYRGARISRSRLRSLRHDLDITRNAVTDLHENFWVTSEQDIREMLQKTEQKIGRVMGALDKAA